MTTKNPTGMVTNTRKPLTSFLEVSQFHYSNAASTATKPSHGYQQEKVQREITISLY
jgi:hypothetical protein